MYVLKVITLYVSVVSNSIIFVYQLASLQKVKSLRENLLACKSLLHCKREELKKYWMDGLEYNEVLNLLDRM